MDPAPKILLACPISAYKDYCLFEWLAHIRHYVYPNLDYYFVDNSKDPTHAEKVRALGFEVDWINPAGRNNREYITDSWNLIRDKILAGPWEYHFSNECDVFAPADTILKLLAHCQVNDIPIAGAHYPVFDGAGRQLLIQDKFLKYGEYPMTNLPKMAAFLFSTGALKQCIGIGQGCVLIHKDVYQNILFRIQEDKPDHPDTYLWADVHGMGLECHVDTSIHPYHRNSSWTQIFDNLIPLKNG